METAGYSFLLSIKRLHFSCGHCFHGVRCTKPGSDCNNLTRKLVYLRLQRITPRSFSAKSLSMLKLQLHNNFISIRQWIPWFEHCRLYQKWLKFFKVSHLFSFGRVVSTLLHSHINLLTHFSWWRGKRNDNTQWMCQCVSNILPTRLVLFRSFLQMNCSLFIVPCITNIITICFAELIGKLDDLRCRVLKRSFFHDLFLIREDLQFFPAIYYTEVSYFIPTKPEYFDGRLFARHENPMPLRQQAPQVIPQYQYSVLPLCSHLHNQILILLQLERP